LYKPLKIGTKWENFRNGHWVEIINFAEDVETMDKYVVYKRISKPGKDEEISDKWNLRLISTWTELVEFEGNKVPRFKEVK